MRRRAARKLELFEIALQRLDAARALMHPSSVKEYSVAISDVVRQYIEAAMQVTATHRTTEEFLHGLLSSSNAALAAHRGLLADFLSQCDMAKFAGVGLSMQIMESLHRSARSFVIETAKPWREADADVAEAIDFCGYYAAEMLKLDRWQTDAFLKNAQAHRSWENEEFAADLATLRDIGK